MIPHKEFHFRNNVINFLLSLSLSLSLSLTQQPNLGLDRFNAGDSTAHKTRHTVIAATCTTQKKHKRKTSTTSAEFEPAIPTIERPQTYTLDRMATGISRYYLLQEIMK